MKLRLLALCIPVMLVLAVGFAPAVEEKDKKKEVEKDVPYVPTPKAVVEKMLEMAKVKKTDVVYDLGCGDGRIVCMAAKKFGCKAIGFDIDPDRIKESNANVKSYKVDKLVQIKNENIFKVDLSKASVITMYLLPEVNVKMVPQLKKLKAGSRIVSHDFDIEGYKPDQTVKMKDKEGVEHTIYLFTAPLKPVKK